MSSQPSNFPPSDLHSSLQKLIARTERLSIQFEQPPNISPILNFLGRHVKELSTNEVPLLEQVQEIFQKASQTMNKGITSVEVLEDGLDPGEALKYYLDLASRKLPCENAKFMRLSYDDVVLLVSIDTYEALSKYRPDDLFSHSSVFSPKYTCLLQNIEKIEDATKKYQTRLALAKKIASKDLLSPKHLKALSITDQNDIVDLVKVAIELSSCFSFNTAASLICKEIVHDPFLRLEMAKRLVQINPNCRLSTQVKKLGLDCDMLFQLSLVCAEYNPQGMICDVDIFDLRKEYTIVLLEMLARYDGLLVAKEFKRKTIQDVDARAVLAVTCITSNVNAADYLKLFQLNEEGLVNAIMSVAKQNMPKAAKLCDQFNTSSQHRYYIVNECFTEKKAQILPFIDDFHLDLKLGEDLKTRCQSIEMESPHHTLESSQMDESPIVIEEGATLQSTLQQLPTKCRQQLITPWQVLAFLAKHVQYLTKEDILSLQNLKKEFQTLPDIAHAIHYYVTAAGVLELSFEEDQLLIPILDQDKMYGSLHAANPSKSQRSISVNDCIPLIQIINKKYNGTSDLKNARMALAKFFMSQAIYDHTTSENKALRVAMTCLSKVKALLHDDFDGVRGLRDCRPKLLEALEITAEEDYITLLSHNANARFLNSCNPSLFLTLPIQERQARVQIAKKYAQNAYVTQSEHEETTIAIGKTLLEDDVHALQHFPTPPLELLILAAKKDLGYTIPNFKKHYKGENLFTFLQVCKKHQPQETARYLHLFGITVKKTDQEQIIELLEGAFDDIDKNNWANEFIDIHLSDLSAEEKRNRLDDIFAPYAVI